MDGTEAVIATLYDWRTFQDPTQASIEGLNSKNTVGPLNYLLA